MPAELGDLSIVIVTWHSSGDVGPLLASLARVLAGGAELVVVENASGDATPKVVCAAVPEARLIVNDWNRGFAAAANQGLAASRGAFVLFVNPDAVVLDDAIARALAYADGDPAIGIVGCRTLNANGKPQPTVDRFHTAGGLVAEALIGRRGLRARPRGVVPVTSGDVDWVYGSFLLCRRAALTAVGGFDEAYEMYGEDLDLCHRVRAAGFRVVYCAEATIVHRGNRSGALRYGGDRDVAVLKGTLRFFRRRRGAGAECAFRLLAGTSFVVKALVNAVWALGPGGAPAGTRARLYARMVRLCARGDPAAAGRSPAGGDAAVLPAERLRSPVAPGIQKR